MTKGWTDDAEGDALRHTVTLRDDDRAVELSVIATIPPGYEIREAHCRPLAGALAPTVARGVASLAGTRMVAGFTRSVSDAVGAGEDASLVVDAAIEIARLARQVTKLPRERAERAARGDALECWQLDTTGWFDLPDSCFAYSAAGRALFGTRPVTSPMQPDLYSPRAGQRRIFERRKVARLERADGRLRLFHSMDDNNHRFEITYEIDLATGRIVTAEHVAPRLPYIGLCSEPQARIASLVGEAADEGLSRRLGPLLGGPSGCAELHDLSADLVKLLRA